MNKNLIYILVVILLAAGIWALMNRPPVEMQQENDVPANDTTTLIDSDLQKITVETPDADFKDIDTELNTL